MDYRAKDGEMRRVHRETVDVLARFGRDGRLEPCVVVLKDCRAFRIDEVLMASGFGPVRHGKTPENASRHNLATTGRPRRTHRAPMCHDAMLHNAPRCNTMMPCAVRGAFVAAEK